MTKEDVIDRLTAHRNELHDHGVKSLGIFGSVARGEAGRSSDVDVVVELNRPLSLFGLSDLKFFIQTILEVNEVDLITYDGIHPALKDNILAEIVHVI